MQFAERLGFNAADIASANQNTMLGPIPQHQPSTINATITDGGIATRFNSQLPDNEIPSGNINKVATLMSHIIASGAWIKLTRNENTYFRYTVNNVTKGKKQAYKKKQKATITAFSPSVIDN